MLSPESSPPSTEEKADQSHEPSSRRRVSPTTITKFGLPTPSSSSLSQAANNPSDDHGGDIILQTPRKPEHPIVTIHPASSFRHKRNKSQSELEFDNDEPASGFRHTRSKLESDEDEPSSSFKHKVRRSQSELESDVDEPVSPSAVSTHIICRKRSRLTESFLDTPVTRLAASFADTLHVPQIQQLPTPGITPAKRPFKGLLQELVDHSTLSYEFAARLPIDVFISLYAIYKPFHFWINSAMKGHETAYTDYYARVAANIFDWTQYRRETIYDPAVRPVKHGVDNCNRLIPGLRWLQRVAHRELVVARIIAALASKGIRLPLGTSTVLKKIWFLLDHSTTGSRTGIIRDPKMWTKRDLLLANMLFIKLDLRFGDPKDRLANGSLRTLLFTQKSLEPMLRVVEGYYSHHYSEFVKLVIEAFYIEELHTGRREDDDDDDEEDDEDFFENGGIGLAAMALADEDTEESELAEQGLEYAPQTVQEYLDSDGVRPTQPLGTNPAPHLDGMFQFEGGPLWFPADSQPDILQFNIQLAASGMQFPAQQAPNHPLFLNAANATNDGFNHDGYDDDDSDYDPEAYIEPDPSHTHAPASTIDASAFSVQSDVFNTQQVTSNPLLTPLATHLSPTSPNHPLTTPQTSTFHPPTTNPWLRAPLATQPLSQPPNPDTLLGVPHHAHGSLQREHHSRLSPPLVDPATLLVAETVRRGLRVQDYVEDFMLWGFMDPRSGKAVPVVQREWLERSGAWKWVAQGVGEEDGGAGDGVLMLMDERFESVGAEEEVVVDQVFAGAWEVMQALTPRGWGGLREGG